MPNANEFMDQGKFSPRAVDPSTLELLVDDVLAPGSVLFLPRGCVHGTDTQGLHAASTSLTVTPHISSYDLSFDKLMLCALNLDRDRAASQAHGRHYLDLLAPLLFEPTNGFFRAELPVGFLGKGATKAQSKRRTMRSLEVLFSNASSLLGLPVSPEKQHMQRAVDVFWRHAGHCVEDTRRMHRAAVNSQAMQRPPAKLCDPLSLWKACGFDTRGKPLGDPLPRDMYNFFLEQQKRGMKDWHMWT